MDFIPQNELEKILMIAAKDPACRPQFYDCFVKSKIFIIPRNLTVINSGKVQAGQDIQLTNIDINGKQYIPFFTSIERIRVFIQQEVQYLALNALEFLKLTEGAELLLNPNSQYGKEFSKTEIKSILNGTIGIPSETYTMNKETSVQIGQPANYPHDLANALINAFKKTKEVKKAYLAHIFNPEMDKFPHTIIAIEVTDNWDKVIRIVGMVADSMKIPEPPVDFIQLTSNGSLRDYFINETKPFYQKKILGIF